MVRNLTENEVSELNDIFDIPSISLGSIMALSHCNIEITLNYPRTAIFRRMKAEDVKLMYSRLLDYIFYQTQLAPFVKDRQITFETCKNGDMHSHANYLLEMPSHYVNGLVMSVVKAWLSQMPKAHSHYNSENFFTQYHRYKSPSICCQYTYIEDIKRTKIWCEYIAKDIILSDNI